MRLTTLIRLGVATLVVAVSAIQAGKAEITNGNVNKPGEKQAAFLLSEWKPVPYVKEYIRDRNTPRGAIKKVRDGKNGTIFNVYQVLVPGKGAQVKKLIYQAIDPAVSELYLIGEAGYKTSRGSFGGRKVVMLTATAYDPGPGSCGKFATGYTATGLKAVYGIVAVDTSIIPMGTHMYIEGYGYAIAGDRGSAIKGRKIDLCFHTRKEALKFGRKKVKVHILV
jgi:3D (Asp-Asp-Asp) domain-containing protein